MFLCSVKILFFVLNSIRYVSYFSALILSSLASLSYFWGKVWQPLPFSGRCIGFLHFKLLRLDWKKKAISTAELLQRFWTWFQGNWRLCGSVVEAVQRPLWVDWFSCLFGPYKWLGRTQAHVHSHTNTFNASLKRRHKGKSPFFIGKKQGQTGSLCFVIPGCLCSLVFLSCIIIIRLASDHYTGPQGLWEILAVGELKWCCYIRNWAEVVPLTWMQSKTTGMAVTIDVN